MCVRESNIDKCQKIAGKIVEEILAKGKDISGFDRSAFFLTIIPMPIL